MARERTQRPKRPATTPEMREAQLVDKAYDLVEERIEAGTASSQETTFFLKAGSMRERLERQRMEHEIELMEVKKEQLTQQARIEELYVGAIEAMRGYSGLGSGAVDSTAIEE
jgi:hypothetical protein